MPKTWILGPVPHPVSSWVAEGTVAGGPFCVTPGDTPTWIPPSSGSLNPVPPHHPSPYSNPGTAKAPAASSSSMDFHLKKGNHYLEIRWGRVWYEEVILNSIGKRTERQYWGKKEGIFFFFLFKNVLLSTWCWSWGREASVYRIPLFLLVFSLNGFP